jgi:hypothetical protein
MMAVLGIEFLNTKYEEAVSSVNDFISNEKSGISLIDSKIYFITIPTLRTIAAFVAAEDDNYVYCFNEYIAYGVYGDEVNASSGKLMEFVKQSEILEAFDIWYRGSDVRISNAETVYSGGENSSVASEGVVKDNVLPIALIAAAAVLCASAGVAAVLKKINKTS